MDTQSPSRSPQETLTSEIDENDVMPLSAWISLGLGIIGLVAIGMPQMLVFPGLALLLGLFALWTPPGVHIVPFGRWLAYFSIALSCFIFSTSLGKWQFEQNRLIAEAKNFGLDWLEILQQGRVAYATELLSQRSARQLLGVDLDKYYSGLEEDRRSTYERVGALKAKIDLAAGDRSPQWKAVRTSSATRFYNTFRVLVEFEDQNQLVKGPVKLELKREHDAVSGNNEWWVELRE